ncbi:unnamed protein product [Durusdinium trenchii]|uniref:Piezo non-specific cation channel R-Ras-binding domain-containing protein n=1 Tax=Durusdinium trenchii TaxID=1381693 RepID=A0ABP0JVT8_9DINO
MAFPSHFTVVDLAPAALTTLPAWAREMMELMPSRDEVMGFLHCRSAEVLVLSIFLLVYPCPKDFLTSVQLILCLVLLAVPKRLAKYTSKFFTASAGVALMGQVLGFTVLRFNKELMRYFGMAPNVALVCRQLLILIFAKLEEMVEAPAPVPAPMEQEMVVLGGSQRSGSEMPAAWRIALRSDPVTEVRRLLLAVPQMAAVCIVAINAVEETAWCLPPLAVVGAFYASGAMVKPPLETGKRIPDQARFWIQVMAFSLAVGMLGEICTALWWPPWEGVPGKPQPAAIGLWDMCRNYDPWSPGLARSVDGRAQFPGMHAKAGWVPQRQRCGQDVVYWLCLESGIRVPKFALFFVLCWILRTDWERRPDRGRAAEPRSRWFRRTMASVSTRFFESLAPRRSTTVAERESELKLFIITLAGIFCWIFVIVACGLQRQFNLVALGYLWMALATSSSVTNATLYHDPVRAVLWPARAVGIFNFLVIMAFSVCQCPSFPCPYAAKLEGLGGPDHISRFLSGEQCLYASRHAVSGEASDAWALGPLFQSVGMIKTGGALSGTLEELVHCLVFVSCLVQRILVERWNEDLREHFKRRKALLDFRAEWYAEKLATSRQVQLSMWDTKRQVLLNKLGRVTKQLNTLRSIWDGQRPAFTEEEEEENLQKARVEHICLQGGVNELLVSGLLKEFTKNYADQLLNLPSQQRLQAQAIIDKGVVDYLHRRYLRKLKMITSADEAASKKHLIQECQNEVEGIWKDVKGEENDAVELEEAPVEPSSSFRSRKSEETSQAQTVRASFSSEAAVDEPKPLMGMWWVELCGTFVDDMLFIREKDETLYEHRKGNSPRLLLCKALLSQSVLALVVAGALQFMSLRSLTSAISISVVVMALMAFPHVPWTVWVALQWLNLAVIFAKVAFQLPIFCEDGHLQYLPCQSLCDEEMPFTALLGLVKTQENASDPCSLARPTLGEILWADVVFAVVLLLVMCAARLGGRFGSTAQILNSLKVLEKKNRRMSTYLNREMLKAALGKEADREAASDSDSDKEEEDQEAPPTGSQPVPQEEPARVDRRRRARARSEAQKWLERGRRWLKEYVVLPAYVRKPAMDLYEIRLCIALICLAILVFGWSTMVDSGRSFSKALKTNNFSTNQVRVLVLFMLMIVMDRALYTWYRGDHAGHADDGQPSKTTYTWKGLMARVVQKILVLVHVVSIHALFIQQWSRKLVPKRKVQSEVSLISFSTLSLFYILYLTYLALSSLQLKYDVHVMRGGLRFCHSTDIGRMLIFKVYSAIPFLNELRVITDWTVTETCMNLFMWMKLEDAHHSLYRTRLDMEGRAMTDPASARPLFEKFYMGVALLVLLMALLVGPIIFFSALNTFMLTPGVVTTASMSVDLRVEANYGHRTLNLYTAYQEYIKTSDEAAAQRFQKRLVEHEIPISLQYIRFPLASDEFWESSTALQQMMAKFIDPERHPEVSVKFRLSLHFQPNASLPVETFQEVAVGNDTRKILYSMFSHPDNQEAISFVVPGLFPNFRRIGSASAITPIDFIRDQEETQSSDVQLSFEPGEKDKHPAIWYVTGNAANATFGPEKTAAGIGTSSLSLTLTLVSNYLSSSSTTKNNNQKQMSINSLYLGVVLTIGNLFRSLFKGSSKRMIYEEVSDTDLLLDLCDGIYLARVQGNLDAEWMLYHELIRIYRSPELLAHISGNKSGGPRQITSPAPSPATNARWGKVKEHVRANSGLEKSRANTAPERQTSTSRERSRS